MILQNACSLFTNWHGATSPIRSSSGSSFNRRIHRVGAHQEWFFMNVLQSKLLCMCVCVYAHTDMCELHFYARWWCLANPFLQDGPYLHLWVIFAPRGHICSLGHIYTYGPYLHMWVIFACDAFNLWCLKLWQVLLFVFICMVFQWLYL